MTVTGLKKGFCPLPGCGEPGRLYPCGWRDDRHSPGVLRAAAEAAAHRHGIEFIGHRPAVRRWHGEGGFKQRNQKIADTCTRALRISCANSTTFGSGWTVQRAAEQGVPVRQVRINPDGAVDDPGWPLSIVDVIGQFGGTS